MDVNEHERLSNITLKHKLMQRNSSFIDIVPFTVSYSRGFKNKHSTYSKMSVKQPYLL
jgi:hypothetical protein